MALTDSLRDIAVNHGWPVCDEAADKIDQLERDLLGHSDYELGKNDGWEACETCHGIVDGVSPHRRAIESEVRAEAQEPVKQEEYDPAIFEVLLKTFATACAFGTLPERLDAASALRKFYTSQQPVAKVTVPCPKCVQWAASWDSVNEITGKEISALQAKVAEQSAEIERLKSIMLADSTDAEKALMQQVAQQAERIAELESFRAIAVENANVTANEAARYQKRIAEKDALIEQCGKALNQHHSLEAKREALAAIEAYKKD